MNHDASWAINIIMRLNEIVSSADPKLVKFWQQTDPQTLRAYLQRGGCGAAARDLLDWLESQGIHTAEMAAPGYLDRQGRKKKGWFMVDQPQCDPDAFTADDRASMRQQGFNPSRLKDRTAWMTRNGLEDDLRWIPHSWVEIGTRILDPSGFMPNGRSGQFDQLVKDKTTVEDRYRYFR